MSFREITKSYLFELLHVVQVCRQLIFETNNLNANPSSVENRLIIVVHELEAAFHLRSVPYSTISPLAFRSHMQFRHTFSNFMINTVHTHSV